MNGKILNKEALKAWILSKVVTLTNNLLATTPGVSAMDAAQGPVIQGQIDAINSNFGGCSFEQEGDDFYITGADAVRKKLGSFDIDSISVRSKSETLTFNSASGTTSKTMTVGAGLILYKSLFPVIKKVVVSSVADFSYTHTFSFSYNTTTGVLTVSRHSNGNMLGNSNATVDVYYFLPE